MADPGAPRAAPELLVATHRGPVSHRRLRGRLVADRGAGGLVGAISPVMKSFGGTWICSALTDEDREVAKVEVDGFALRYLDLPEPMHADHYDRVSNEVLWFVFHYLFDLPHEPRFDASFDRAWSNYRAVNHMYAEAIAAHPRADAVFVEDYHLMLAGAQLRELGWSGAPLLYFHHTPWSEPDYFSLLPDEVAREILRGVLAFDVAGFHATRWARAFMACCERLLPGARGSEDRVTFEGRTTRIVVAPVPLDVARLRTEVSSPRVARWREKLAAEAGGRRMLVRVDRVELSKNVLRGFLAWEEMLTDDPGLASEAWFCALVYPSRPRVTEYRRYLGECLAAARRIEARFPGTLALYVEDDYHRSLAGMTLASALLVNPVWDGLNLVAKEGAAIGEPALVLSRNAGVYEELGPAAIGVNPFDVAQTASALRQALCDPPHDPARLRAMATATTPEGWVRGRLEAAGL